MLNYLLLSLSSLVVFSTPVLAQMRQIPLPVHYALTENSMAGGVGILNDNTAYLKIDGEAAKILAANLEEGSFEAEKPLFKFGQNLVCSYLEGPSVTCFISFSNMAKGIAAADSVTILHTYHKAPYPLPFPKPWCDTSQRSEP